MSFLPDHTGNCIGVLIDEFLEDLRTRQYSIATVEAYRDAIRRLARFAAKRRIERIQDITSANVESFARKLVKVGFTSGSRYAYLQRVRTFFAFLEARQYLLVNPFEEFPMPVLERELQSIPTESDMTKLLQQPDTATPAGVRDRALLEVAYSTGARLAELTAMNLDDPDFAQKSVKVTGKGGKDRVLPLGSAASKWLREYVRNARPEFLAAKQPDQPALWIGRRGGRYSYQLIGKGFRAYGKQAGISIPVTPHSIRRACATHLLANGAHPMEVQTLLGHSSVSTLKHYLKVTITDMKQTHKSSNPGR